MRFLAVIIVFYTGTCFAQDVLDNSRPAYKWQTINTDKYRLLFSPEFAEKAQYMANLFQALYNDSNVVAPRKTTYIFRDKTTFSNGFVAMGPRRSEIYTMPSQSSFFTGTNDWLEKVVIHEFRHVIQYDHSRRGWNKLFYYMLGEYSQAGMAYAAAPQWYWEGEAVFKETSYTHSGRGRIPAYHRAYRSNLMERKPMSYSKQYLGSYKHYVPSYYVLGTQMIPWGIQQTNDYHIWEKITARSFSRPFMPNIFSRTMKRYTGKKLPQMYNDMQAHLKDHWQKTFDEQEFTSFDVLSPSSKIYTDYRYPQPLPDGRVLALKRGMADIDAFVALGADGKEEKLHVPGIINYSGMLSSNGGQIVWNEFHMHPRWRAEDYSVIKIHDVETGKTRTLTNKTRYSGAAISPDGERVVTTTTASSYDHSIVLFDVERPSEAVALSDPSNAFYSNVRFGATSGELLAVRTLEMNKELVLIRPDMGEELVLVSNSPENLAYPAPAGKYVLYNSDYSGLENIYAIDTVTLERFQVTSSKYGSFNPAYNPVDQRIYYNEHTVNGLAVVSTPFSPGNWVPIEDVKTIARPFDEVYEQEGNTDFLKTVPGDSFEVKKYNKLRGLINPHSWGPFINASLTGMDLGVYSQDVLSTTSLYAGYTFDIYEFTGQFNASLSYQGLYPIFDLEYFQGGRNIHRGVGDTVSVIQWKEQGLGLTTRVPWQFVRSKFIQNLEIKNTVGIKEVWDFSNDINGNSRIINGVVIRDLQNNGELMYNTVSVSASNRLKRSYRDMYSRWGQSVNASYTNTLNNQFDGGIFALNSWLYFPGIFKHHTLRTYWAWQNRKITPTQDNYLFRGRIRYPRGEESVIRMEESVIGTFEDFYSMSVDYIFPLLYPDLRIGPLLYIQRIRADLFFDYGYGRTYIQQPNYFYQQQEFMSTGIELKFDFNVVRFYPKIEIGVGYYYGFTAGHKVRPLWPSVDL